MQNKLCIIASWFLFSGACCAVSPAHALTTAKSATPFMSCMQNYARRGVFFLSGHIADSAAKTVANSISHYLFRQDQAAENSKVSLYARKGLGVASSILTQAGISWALLPFLFPQKRHSFQFSLALTTASAITAAVTQRVKGYCLSKVSHKSTKKYLLSLGFAASAVAGLEYLKVKTPYAITRSCMGISELPILPVGLSIVGALLDLLKPLQECNALASIMHDTCKHLEAIQQLSHSPGVDLWQQIEKEVDAVAHIFINTEYSYKQLHANALIPRFVLTNFLNERESVFSQLANFYLKCPGDKERVKCKLANILRSTSLEDLEYEIAACEDLLAREEQTLVYANELITKLEWLGKPLSLRTGLRGRDIFSEDDKKKLEDLALRGFNVAVGLEVRLGQLKKNTKVEAEESLNIDCMYSSRFRLIKQQIDHCLSSLKTILPTSTQGQISKLKQELELIVNDLSSLRDVKLVVPRNYSKIDVHIKSFALEVMQILEPKFTSISQQLKKNPLSREEFNNLSRYFQSLNWIMNKSVRPFVEYLDQGGSRQLLEHISRVQIPQLRATLADAAFALKFKTS